MQSALLHRPETHTRAGSAVAGSTTPEHRRSDKGVGRPLTCSENRSQATWKNKSSRRLYRCSSMERPRRNAARAGDHAPEDIYEQEADRVAAEVMHMPAPRPAAA